MEDAKIITELSTVCPGSNDPPEKNNQKMRFTPFINYYDIIRLNIIRLQSKKN